MDRAVIAKSNTIQQEPSRHRRVDKELVDENAITNMKITVKEPSQDKSNINKRQLQSSVFFLIKENIVSDISSEKSNNHPKISNYKIDEQLTLKEYIKRHGRANHKSNPTTTEF